PWRIRLTDDLRDRVAEEAPDDFLTMYQTMRLLGVSRQTVWQRVKRGEIKALHVRRGRKKGLRLKVIRSQSDLFDQTAHVQNEVHLPAVDPDAECIERVVRTAAWSEPIREPKEVLLVDRVQQFDHR